MEPKKIALLVGALVVALVTALFARSYLMTSATPVAVAEPKVFAPPAPVGPKVLVATRPLAVGTILDDTSVKYQPWPKELVQGAYYIEGKEAKNDIAVLRGSVVRAAISAGQPITLGSVVQPGDRGFLAAALGAGMRAVTVQVNVVSGVGFFIFPGDRVDLMLTQKVDGAGGPGMSATETIVRNIRVLAADQRTTATKDEQGNSSPVSTSTVTLEVTPRLAEKVQVAMQLGSLSLALRPLAEDQAGLERAIAAGTVNVPDASNPNAERTMMMQTTARPTEDRSSFVTAGDVSRFQRRNVTVEVERDKAAIARIGTPRGVTIVTKRPTITVANGTTSADVVVGGN